MAWWKPHGRVHKTLCDGKIEKYFVFPFLRDGATEFYIGCPCCAFWRGVVAGAAVATAVVTGMVALLY